MKLASAQSAQTKPAALSWVRGPGAARCMGSVEMARAVEKRLRRSVFISGSQAELSVEAYVERSQTAGWSAVIKTSGIDGVVLGERTLTSQASDCDEVSAAATLAIALMIDPEANLSEPSGSFAPPVAPVAAPNVAPVPPSSTRGNQCEEPRPVARPTTTTEPTPVATKAAISRLELRGALSLSMPLTVGLLPSAAPGVALRAAAFPSSSWFGFEVEGVYLFPQESETRSNAGGEFSAFWGGASACVNPTDFRRVSGSLCAGAAAGMLFAKAYGFSDSRHERGLLLNVISRAQLGFRVYRKLRVLAMGDIFIPLQRDRFEVRRGTGSIEVFRMSALAGGFEIGAAYEF